MVPSHAAIRPARKSPSWFDAMTNSEFTALTRPRMSSVVSSWIRVMRITTLIMSAEPSTASSAIDSRNQCDSAKTMMAIAVDRDRAEDDPADPLPRRAVRQDHRGDQRADAGRGAQQAEPPRPGMEHVAREHRQQRIDAAEDRPRTGRA